MHCLAVMFNLVVLSCAADFALGLFKLLFELFYRGLRFFDTPLVFGLFGLVQFAISIGKRLFRRVNLLFDSVVAALHRDKFSPDVVGPFVPAHVVEGRPRYNQRRSRLVYQNRVNLVDYPVFQLALRHLL